MKGSRFFAGILSILFILNSTIPSFAAQKGVVPGLVEGKEHCLQSEETIQKYNIENVLEYELQSESVSDNKITADGIAEEKESRANVVSQNGIELTEIKKAKREEKQKKEELARVKLQEKLKQKDIYAIIYLTDSYEVKAACDKNSSTTAILQSADTVRIIDFSLEWRIEEGITPVIWFLTEFYVGENLQQGYIEEIYLASSDELLKEWKQEFCEIFVGDEISLFAEETKASDIEQFPYTYKVLLKELKAKHPNWIFVPMNVNRDWESCVKEQLGDYSWIYYNQPAEYLGEKINSTWHYASKEGIAYYMDPRNFLTESNIFMFEQNTYNASYHTESALQKFLNNTFMKGVVEGDSQKRTYAKVIYNSGKNRGLSPFNLAARIIQEQGVNGNSQMISGTYPGYEGYYNFYNIGASGSSNTEVYVNGLSYAKEKGWDTRVKALDGGAAFIGNGYILKGQDTLYLQKFDLLKKSGYLHQYMQNIMAPYTEGRSMKTMYQNAGSLNSDFVFKIPVFLNMPKENPLLGISFEETEAELFIYDDSVKKIPFLNTEGKTEEKGKEECPREKEIQVKFEAGDSEKEISDDTTVTWTVADENIVSLMEDEEDNSKAMIRALQSGTTQVTAKVGSFKAKLKVTVKIPMIKAELAQKEIILYQGQKVKIPVNYEPLDTTDDSDVEWWCSYENDENNVNENYGDIVTIEDGSICANKVGTVSVHAKIGAFDGTQESLTCTVTVKPYTITFKEVLSNNGKDIVIDGSYGKTLAEIESMTETVFPWEQTKKDYVFLGWYSKENGKGIEITPDTVLNGNIAAYAYFEKAHEGFFIKPIGNRQYTGSKIRPLVQVYDAESKLLTEDRDYRISYENNTDVSIYSKDTKPTVTVSGIGKYETIKKITFEILPRDISESSVKTEDILLSYTGNVQKAYPLVKDENRTLQRDRDYTLEFSAKETGAYIEAGTYPVIIAGKGNYTGEKTAYITITKRRLLADAVLEKIKEINYNGGEDCVPVIKLSYGKEKLKENVDYTVTLLNSKEVGIAEAIIAGIGNYAGTRKENYRIIGTDIGKTDITGVIDKEYTSAAILQNDFIVSDSKGNVLKENKDYKVSYRNNQEAGNAQIVITGIGSFQGELVKTFSILPYSIEKDDAKVKVSEITQSYVYDKGGVKPEVTVTYEGKPLKKNVDYILRYKNNENIGTKGTENAPTVRIIGKGNFTGEIDSEFTIVSKELAKVQITAKDIVFKNKKSFCFSEPILKEKNSGRILMKGKDYIADYHYEYASDATLWDGSQKRAGEVIGINDIPMPGTVIKVTAEGKGNYKGFLSCTYTIKEAPQELQEELEESRNGILESKNSPTEKPMEILEDTFVNVGKSMESDVLESKEVQEDSAAFLLEKEQVKILQDIDSTQKKENIQNKENSNYCIESEIQKQETQVKVLEKLPEIVLLENSLNNGYEKKEIQYNREENGIAVLKSKSVDILKSHYQRIQKVLYNLEEESLMVTEKQKFLLKLILLGCSLGLSCVMIRIRKKKKED